MHVGDTIFIFCLALIIFGPKKLPEIGRQIAKLMVEFRRASNEFKMQIEEELRASEESERQKEITAAKTIAQSSELPTSAPMTAGSAALAASGDTPGVPVIAPPSMGVPVNHTFDSAETAVDETSRDAWKAAPADAYPEPASGFNAGLNTASNGLAEDPVEAAPAAANGFSSEPVEFANVIPEAVEAGRVEHTPAAVHHD
jgi:sec-independent protein translocase protein TatB